ncbi:MAG: GcvT family protein [Paracoccaceae bacterium]
MERTDVVVIGGGAVGVSCLYHLALKGADCVLLERDELTAGSTWHAAGNCPNFSTSWAVMNLQRYSLSLYRRLAEEVDYPMNYHVTGALRLAHDAERMREFAQARAMGDAQGLRLEGMTPAQLAQAHPFLETHDLAGGLWDPEDGDVDPAQLTQALARGARMAGATIHRHRPATGVRRGRDGWVVETAAGDIACAHVVNAAGYYAARVGDWFVPHGGRPVPMTTMSHQYLLTEPVEEIAAWTAEHGRKLPMIRDVDSSYYLRQEKTGLNLGPYERHGRAHWTGDEAMPEDFSFQLWPDDLDRIEWYVEDAMARVPLLGASGMSRVVNGPIPYTPDGLPLLGPMPGVANAWEACVFTFGIVQAGGAGKVLAEWIVDGAPEWDMWDVDPRRFTGPWSPADLTAAALEVYGHEYAMHFPRLTWPAARDRRLSPIDRKLREMGAVMAPFGGWERAAVFARPGDDFGPEATRTWERGPWDARIRDEVLAVRDGVGVLDLPGFSRFDLTGAGAAAWLQGLIAGALPKVGRLGLAYFPDDRGRLVTEMSVARRGEDAFTLVTAAAAQRHDFEWLWRRMPDHLALTDRTEEFSTLVVTGPASRDLLARIGTDADLTAAFLTHQAATLAGVPCTLARVSFAGELGWEVHAGMDRIPTLYGAIHDAGASPFGMWALEAMRIEKGWMAWKREVSTDYTLRELGLERFMTDGHDCPGRDALRAPPERRAVTLTYAPGVCDPPQPAMIRHAGRVVGEATSCATTYRVDPDGLGVALGMVPAALAVPGTVLHLDVFGDLVPATVHPTRAVYDPELSRVRA